MAQAEHLLSKYVGVEACNKMLGLIYGFALGDAVGLSTEFNTKEPTEIFPYTKPADGYSLCNWSSNTNQLILLLQSITEEIRAGRNPINVDDFCKRLLQWKERGFPECGDKYGYGLDGITQLILKKPEFAEDPIKTAATVWECGGRALAGMTSLPRAVPISIFPEDMINSRRKLISQITHADPRCTAVFTAQCKIFNRLLCTRVNSNIIASILAEIADIFANELSREHNDVMAATVKHAFTGSVSDLQLSTRYTDGVIGAFGCSIYALQVINFAINNNLTPSFKKFAVKIAREMGQSGNVAIGGATLGVYLGYSRLPADWLKLLPNIAFLDKIVDNFLQAIMSSVSPPQ